MVQDPGDTPLGDANIPITVTWGITLVELREMTLLVPTLTTTVLSLLLLSMVRINKKRFLPSFYGLGRHGILVTLMEPRTGRTLKKFLVQYRGARRKRNKDFTT